MNSMGRYHSTVLLTLWVACVGIVSANFGGGKPPTVGAEHVRFGDKANIQDRGHIQEHLEGVVDTEQNYSEEEMQFHYFKVHDSDNNNKLDGTELIAALTHYHKDTDAQHYVSYSDEELINAIDSVLDEEDTNVDGYIDYPEFLMSKRGVDLVNL